MSFWLLTALSAGVLACDAAPWRDRVEGFWSTHPRAEAADLYKLAHQGIMGSEHAVGGDTAMVNRWMRDELARLSSREVAPEAASPMFEVLPPDGRYLRVHLRPFVKAGGDVSLLLRAFVATANGPKGDTAQFACLEQALQTMPITARGRSVLVLIAEQRRSGFPAVHHSAAFEAAYAPAYRVVAAAWRDSLQASVAHRASRLTRENKAGVTGQRGAR